LIRKVTVPDGATGLTELAPTVAVKVTVVPTLTEDDGAAVIVVVVESGFTVCVIVAAVATVKLLSPE
jgi:hypothetical protein